MPVWEMQMTDNTEMGRGRWPGCLCPSAVRGRQPDRACVRPPLPLAEIGLHIADLGVDQPVLATRVNHDAV